MNSINSINQPRKSAAKFTKLLTMRHGKKFNHLKRKKGHRRALLKNMACALIEHKRIRTTLAKAKALRIYLEPLVTKGRTNTTHSRRVVFSYLQNKDAIKELFGPIAAKVGDRPGGYLRILRTGFRKGDSAEMCIIEFVDYNETYSTVSGPKKKRRRRRGGSGTNNEAAAATETAVAETAVADAGDVVDVVADVAEETVEDAADVIEDVADDIADTAADAADDVKDA